MNYTLTKNKSWLLILLTLTSAPIVFSEEDIVKPNQTFDYPAPIILDAQQLNFFAPVAGINFAVCTNSLIPEIHDLRANQFIVGLNPHYYVKKYAQYNLPIQLGIEILYQTNKSSDITKPKSIYSNWGGFVNFVFPIASLFNKAKCKLGISKLELLEFSAIREMVLLLVLAPGLVASSPLSNGKREYALAMNASLLAKLGHCIYLRIKLSQVCFKDTYEFGDVGLRLCIGLEFNAAL